MISGFEQKLADLIDRYGLNKTEKDAYEILVKEDGNEIKSMMKEAKLKKFEGLNYKVSYVVQDRSHIDEAQLLKVIHSYNVPDSLGIIKTREYIDEDALESAIYSGALPEDVLEKISECRVKNDVVSLRLSTRKEKS